MSYNHFYEIDDKIIKFKHQGKSGSIQCDYCDLKFF